MRRFLVRWAFNVAALFAAAGLVSGISYGDEWGVLVLAAFVFSLVNMVVRPIVFVLSLPVVILTLGIALFFVNLAMLELTSWLVTDFRIDTFGDAMLGTVVVWAVNVLLNAVLGRRLEPARL